MFLSCKDKQKKNTYQYKLITILQKIGQNTTIIATFVPYPLLK